MLFCTSVSHVLSWVYCGMPMPCRCKLTYLLSYLIIDSQLILINCCIFWLPFCLPLTVTSHFSSLPPIASTFPLHWPLRCWPQSFHISLPCPLCILKTNLRRVSLMLSNFHEHLFLIFVWHIQLPTQMQLVQLLLPLWMPFLLHRFNLTQLHRHTAKQLAGTFFLPLANLGSTFVIPTKVTSFTLFPQSTAPFWPFTFYIPLYHQHLILLTALRKIVFLPLGKSN